MGRDVSSGATPEPQPVDDLGVPRPPVEELTAEELRAEVRRLRLRVDALRRQRDERIDDIVDLEHGLAAALAGGDASLEAIVPVHEWRRRAETAERHYAALMQSRTMRLLHRPRQVYARLLAARRGGARRAGETT